VHNSGSRQLCGTDDAGRVDFRGYAALARSELGQHRAGAPDCVQNRDISGASGLDLKRGYSSIQHRENAILIIISMIWHFPYAVSY
jgi:hypothetical protein